MIKETDDQKILDPLSVGEFPAAEFRWQGPPDPWTISFNHGETQSRLMFWKDGRCTFEGNADEAAKTFFEAVMNHYRIQVQPEERTDHA